MKILNRSNSDKEIKWLAKASGSDDVKKTVKRFKNLVLDKGTKAFDEINAEFDKEEENAAKEAELNEAETKKLDMLKDRLVGNGTSVAAEYRTMLRESMKYIIPRFERTRVVKLVQMPEGTWVLCVLVVC